MILCTGDLCRNFGSLLLPSKIRAHRGQLSKGFELTLQPSSEKYPKSLLASSELDFTVFISGNLRIKIYPKKLCLLYDRA